MRDGMSNVSGPWPPGACALPSTGPPTPSRAWMNWRFTPPGRRRETLRSPAPARRRAPPAFSPIPICSVSNEPGQGWVELEFPECAVIERIVWSRDREQKYSDRLAIDYQIEVAAGSNDWGIVAS